jgi:CHAT domain-containing protein
MRIRTFVDAKLASLVLVALWGCVGAHAQADPFAECERRFEAEPLNRESASCYFEVARRRTLWQEGAQKLRVLRDRDRTNPWLPLSLGHIFLYQEPERAEEPYRDAMDIAQRLDLPSAEVEARVAYARLAAKLDRLDEADEVFARAVEIAEQEHDPFLQAIVQIRQAWQYHYRGRPDDAYHLLRSVEKVLFPGGPEFLRKQCLDALAAVSLVLGKTEESLGYKEKFLAIAQAAGDVASEAEAMLGIAVLHITVDLPTPENRQRILGLLEETLAKARAADHPSIEGRAHRELGKMLGGEPGSRHLEECMSIAKDFGNKQLLNECRGALAANKAAKDPGEAQRLMQQVLEADREASSLWLSAYGSVERLIVDWETKKSQAEMTAGSLAVLDAIEALRELQVTGTSRAGLLSLWSEAYYWLSGRLLDDETGSAVDRNPEMAFHVTERMRAQVLLETLIAARAASPPPAADPWVRQLATVLEHKVEIQSRLLDPQVDNRQQLNAELLDIESQEASLRHRIAQASPSYASLRNPAAAANEIRQDLRDDEALFSYQLATDRDIYSRFAGGAWLQVLTRNGLRCYRLPDRVAIEPALDTLFRLPNPETAEKGLATLYRGLLEDALRDLPPEIDKLVIIPDGKLHRLPFSLLRPASDADPLITRYEVTIAPSASLWLRWRRQDPSTSAAPVLALADPIVAGQESTEPASTRGWALARGTQLPPLPYARREGRMVVRILGGRSRLREGEAATEAFLKSQDLRQFSILHFATHAVIDEQIPERSAVFLTPGTEDEDGWLQPQEIVQLDLRGRIVVLASCDTAAGQILRGEGAMSLARSFFQAGAAVVVASLWQLPDDRTSALFKEFYRRLARGASVAEALATAQREMIHKGASAREWAGLVVLGNGALVPFPGGLPKPIPYGLIAGIAVAVALLAAIVLWRRSLHN